MKWRIGDVTITRVVELTSSTIGNFILPQATEDRINAIDWIESCGIDPTVRAETLTQDEFRALATYFGERS